jgi:hypothetical protein
MKMTEKPKMDIGKRVEELQTLASISPHYREAPEVRNSISKILEESFDWTLQRRMAVPDMVPTPELSLAYENDEGKPGLLVLAAPMGKLTWCDKTVRAGRAANFETIAQSDGVSWIISRPRDGLMLRVDSLHACAGGDLALPLLMRRTGDQMNNETLPEEAADAIDSANNVTDQAVTEESNTEGPSVVKAPDEPWKKMLPGVSREEFMNRLGGQVGKTFRQKSLDNPLFSFTVEVEAKDRFVLKKGSEIVDRPPNMEEVGKNKNTLKAWRHAVEMGAPENTLAEVSMVGCKKLTKDVVFEGPSQVVLAVYGTGRTATDELVDINSDPKAPVHFVGRRHLLKMVGAPSRADGGQGRPLGRHSQRSKALPKIDTPILLQGPVSRRDAMQFKVRWEVDGTFTLLSGSEFVAEISDGEKAPAHRDLVHQKHADLIKDSDAVPAGKRQGKPIMKTCKDLSFRTLGGLLPGVVGFSPSSRSYMKCIETGVTLGELVTKIEADIQAED